MRVQIHTKTINFLLVVRDQVLNFIVFKKKSESHVIIIFFMERYIVLLPRCTSMPHCVIYLEVENIQKFYNCKITMLLEFAQLDVNNQRNYRGQEILKHAVP